MKQTQVRFTVLDAILIPALAAGAVYIAWRIGVRLDYHWEWEVIPQYLFRYDKSSGWYVPNMLMQGLFTTIRLSVWATALAMLIGLVMGIFRSGKSLFRRMIGRTYVEAVRNLPPLVLVFIFYFFVSDQIMPLLGVDEFARSRSETTRRVLTALLAPPAQFSAFLSAAVTLAIYEGAYITEIVRAGIQSVEKGQWEAAYALGLSWRHAMMDVVLPQAGRRMIPPLAGQFISTVKDSAIVSVISIQELTFQGMQLMASTYLRFEIWITVTLLYLVLTLALSLAARKLELRLAAGAH